MHSLPLLLLGLALVVGDAIGAEYSYPMRLRLGSNISSSSPSEPLPYCFTYETRKVSGSSSESKFRAKVIKNRRDLLKELNVSASASAQNAFFSGKITSDLTEKYTFSSDSIVWVVSLVADYGDMEIFNEQLKPEYERYLDDPNEFVGRCGDEVVSIETRTATVAAIFSSRNVAEGRTRELKMTVNAEAGNPAGWSGDFSGSFRQFVQEVSANGRIDLEIEPPRLSWRLLGLSYAAIAKG